MHISGFASTPRWALTYSITYSKEEDIDLDAIVMDTKTFNALLLGLEQKFTRI